MSKLQIIDARRMEKLLFKLGFEGIRQKEVMFSKGKERNCSRHQLRKRKEDG